MRLTRSFVASAILACGIFTAVAQSGPAFDVASVKLTAHGRTADGYSHSDLRITGPGRLVGTNASFDECIRWAYGLKEYQVSEPDWMKSDEASYDIEAKAPESTPNTQMRVMLQNLLVERLGLAVHRDTKLLPVYLLVLGQAGPKLKAAPPDAPVGSFSSEGGRDSIRIGSKKASMADLAGRLSRDLDRPVFDRTDTDGLFEIQLDWSRGAGDGVSVFSAIQQIGLRLEPTKERVQILVVDHAEKVPSAN